MISAILNSAILHSAIFHKNTFTHSFWLNWMMAATLNSAIFDSKNAILDSNTLLSFLRLTQKHSHSILTLTQTNSIWLKLIHSHLTWWWQSYWISHLGFSHLSSFSQTHSHLPRLVLNICTKKLHSFILTQLDDCSYLEICHPRLSHFVQKKLHSFILIQIDNGSHFEFCYLGFSILLKKTSLVHFDSTWWYQPSWILPSSIQPFFTKIPSLIHSDSTGWWQPPWILPSLIQKMPSWIQTPCYLLSDSLKNTLPPLWLWLKLYSIWVTRWWQPSWILPSWIQPCCTKLWLNLIQSDSNSFILTQLDDGSHLEFCHHGFSHLHKKNFTCSFSLKLMMAAILNSAILDTAILYKKKFTCSFWLNLMKAAILNSVMLDSDTAILDSDTLLSSLRFTQKHSHSILTLTQTNQSDSNSFILT